MRYLAGTLASIWTIIYGIALAWLALWGANIINYILSVPMGWIGMIIECASHNLGGVVEYIGLLITMGPALMLIFYHLFKFIYRYNSPLENALEDCPSASKIISYIIVFLIMILLIAVCDTRIDQIMPDNIVAGLEFLRNNCNTFILAPVSWAELDFSGQVLNANHYNVFDTSICVAGVGPLIYGLIRNYF